MAGLRIAVVGAGFAAREVHLPGYKAAGAPVAAICDVEQGPAAALAKRFEIASVYADYREMIDTEKPDVVSVCVPNVMHREIALYALTHGAHVICEKPLATSVAEAEEMFETARTAGRLLMAAQLWRFDANSRAIKRIVDAGDLGEIYWAEANGMRRLAIPTWGKFHYASHSAGGAFMDLGVHVADLALWLMGNPRPVRVSATMERRFGQREDIARLLRNAWDPQKFDVEDFAMAMVHFENGAAMLVKASWAAHFDQQQFTVRLIGSEAGATTLPPMVFRNHAGIPADETLQVRGAPQHERQMAHWLRACAGEEEPLVRPEETLNVQRIIEGAYRSAREGAEARV